MTSNTSHSPGPWFISKNNPLFAKDILNEKGDLIARVGSSIEDAHLIAAAPDLLHLLHCVIAEYDGTTEESQESIIETIRETIARAESGEAK